MLFLLSLLRFHINFARNRHVCVCKIQAKHMYDEYVNAQQNRYTMYGKRKCASHLNASNGIACTTSTQKSRMCTIIGTTQTRKLREHLVSLSDLKVQLTLNDLLVICNPCIYCRSINRKPQYTGPSLKLVVGVRVGYRNVGYRILDWRFL